MNKCKTFYNKQQFVTLQIAKSAQTKQHFSALKKTKETKFAIKTHSVQILVILLSDDGDLFLGMFFLLGDAAIEI